MNRYIKKPVVIEAIQLTQSTIKQVYEFVHGTGSVNLKSFENHERWIDFENSVIFNGLDIPTLEDGQDKRAKHVASIGDWIIKGIKGEFYPCKPDIFEASYEKADINDY
jgi:hypothetical protein